MLKRFFLVLACISLLFVSPVFADELETDKVISTMDIESINSSLNKVGLKSISLNPADEYIYYSYAMFSNPGVDFKTLENGSSFSGYSLYIRVGESDITQNNIIRFTLPYGSLSGNYIITRGSFDDISFSGQTVTIYNPHDYNSEPNASDVIVLVPLSEPYTNNTGNPITLNLSGNISVISSGTELLETLVSYFTVNQVVVILVSTISACVGLVFMWWGIRKTSGAIMSAFRRGKLRI